MSKYRGLLVSLPWADYASPSIQIASVASYARRKGYNVCAKHLHLEAAMAFGFDEYFPFMNECGDAMSAVLLFPQRRSSIVRLVNSSGTKLSQKLLKRFEKMMDQLYRSVDWPNYDLIGFTTDLNQLFSSLFFAKQLKRDYPDIKVVLGGHCASSDLGISLLRNFDFIDYCIDGEGEIPFTSLLDYLSSSGGMAQKDVPGLIYRDSDSVVINPRKQLTSLDELPDPDYKHYFDVIDNHPYFDNTCIETFVPIEGGRGCTHKCAFCSDRIQMNGYRSKSPKVIAKQLSRMSRRYRSLSFKFTDLRTHPKKDNELFNLILKQKKDYNLYYDIRADVDKSLIASMRAAGVKNVLIGIEALSTSLLRKMKKGVRAIDNLQVMKYCEELGIQHISNLILSFPTESQMDVDETTDNMDYGLSFQPPSMLVNYTLLAGSTIDVMRRQYNITHVKNSSFRRKLVPPRIEKSLQFAEKTYRRKRRNSYRALRNRFNQWRERYYSAHKEGTSLLSYIDGGSFIKIMDFRNGRTNTTLENDLMKLYLFCDSIRSWSEIAEEFPGWDLDDLRGTLKQLVDLKLMFKEGDDYLSLAIRNLNTQPFRV